MKQITPFGLHLGAFWGPRYETKGTPKWASLIYLPIAWEHGKAMGFGFQTFDLPLIAPMRNYYIYGHSVSCDIIISSLSVPSVDGMGRAKPCHDFGHGFAYGWNPWILCTNQGYHRFLLVFGCLKTLDQKKHKQIGNLSGICTVGCIYLILYIWSPLVIKSQTAKKNHIQLLLCLSSSGRLRFLFTSNSFDTPGRTFFLFFGMAAVFASATLHLIHNWSDTTERSCHAVGKWCHDTE